MADVAEKGAAAIPKLAEQKERKLEKDRLPVVDEEIQGDEKKYKLKQVLGDGGYGTVFLSEDGQKPVAVKTEKYSKSMLHIEVGVLKAANAAKAKHFCELIDYGSNKPEYVYVVMTLLFKDLHKLRSEMHERKFTLSTSIRIAMQALRAIEELHKVGYISRDIKPGNFAPGRHCNKQSKIIFLYDFGLARKYVDKNGKLIPPRKDVGWRGTTRYGSLIAHQRQDLSRRDDVESWFYMSVEMLRGTLPWRLVTDRNAVRAAKQAARAAGRIQFLFETPKQFDAILTMIYHSPITNVNSEWSIDDAGYIDSYMEYWTRDTFTFRMWSSDSKSPLYLRPCRHREGLSGCSVRCIEPCRKAEGRAFG